MRTPRRWTIRARDKFRTIGETPVSRASNVKPLRGRDGTVRPRIGDWRVPLCVGVTLEVLDVRACTGDQSEQGSCPER